MPGQDALFPLEPITKKKRKGKKPGPKPLKVPSERMYFNGLLRPGRDDDLIDWYKSIPDGQKFATLCAVLRSGGGLKAKSNADAAEAKQAAADILKNFVV